MTAPKEATKGKDKDAPNEPIVERLLQERFDQLNRPFICPFCGKTGCKSFWHLLKLGILPRSYMRPKHFFLLYGLLFVVILLISAVYMGFEMITQSDP
ncbi:MAG: hypothetical protein FPO08_00730 [Geobacter sp.]|nr:MAG: hypothetical protein FPO08_00730 [Geobacter sp.]